VSRNADFFIMAANSTTASLTGLFPGTIYDGCGQMQLFRNKGKFVPPAGGGFPAQKVPIGP
jgi:hypothetical protein